MASVTARLSVLGENGYGEPEPDANSALTDLDKGLRSGKIGEQCEAIVRFPRLFAKYPFPILINSAFLKLADVFRLGTNFLRLCVLKVTQQSHKHLDKILNVDEFVRRVYSVIHSNDPLARALTLRTLGSIAYIIPDRRNVHHTVRVSLDSHDAVELEAAIFAAAKFAACSKTFASNICEKISGMIEGLATPVDMKLKLIPIFQYMHHDAQTAATVRELCTDLLPNYPAAHFVLVTLDTLTRLASSSTIDIPRQVDLLVCYLWEDTRQPVKKLALRNLCLLAERGAHMWSESNVQAVLDFTSTTPYKELKCLGFSVLTALAKTVAVSKFSIVPGSPFQSLCLESCYGEDSAVAAKSVQLLTHVALHTYREGHDDGGEFDLFQETASAIESLLLVLITSADDSKPAKTALKMCLACAVSLCEADSSVGHQFVYSFGSLATTLANGPSAVTLCEALAAMGNRQAHVLISLIPDLLSALKIHLEERREDRQLLVMLCTLALQATADCPMTDAVASLTNTLNDSTNDASMDSWTLYRVGRQAARYGHPLIASRVFASIADAVSSEHLHFWLIGLGLCFSAEGSLIVRPDSTGDSPKESSPFQRIDVLSDAINQYAKGISALKSATTQSHTLIFQCEYVRLRFELLQAHCQLLCACGSHRTAPPPAIAASVATATRDELGKCGRSAIQLRKSVKDFQGVAELYGRLSQSYFDMDPATLTNILVLQQSCNLVAYAIEQVALKCGVAGRLFGSGGDRAGGDDMDSNGVDEASADFMCLGGGGSGPGIEMQRMMEASRKAHALARDTIITHADLKPIAYEHIQALLDISRLLTEVPLCYPRFFFQSLQSTIIKLAISPQPRLPGEPIGVQSNSHLALKVEGVVQHGTGQGRFRSVHSVVISISSQLQQQQSMGRQQQQSTSSGIGSLDGKPSSMGGEIGNNMTQTVTPHNDYFSSQFLLAFPAPGVHSVVIDVSVLDENGLLWKTGPRSTLAAKSCDAADPGGGGGGGGGGGSGAGGHGHGHGHKTSGGATAGSRSSTFSSVRY